MILTFRPVAVRPSSWRPSDADRPHSPFSAGYDATLSLLDRELDQLGATNAFLQVELRDRTAAVRKDGQLRSGAVVDHPGVILTVESRRHGTLTYPCDAFRGRSGRPAWQENLRAVALGLEALRRVERYGIADRGQQYAGFAELGAGTAMAGTDGFTPERAAQLLADEANRGFGADWINAESLLTAPDRAELIRGAYRDAARLHHPDAGGDPNMFRLLTAARDLLYGQAVS